MVFQRTVRAFLLCLIILFIPVSCKSKSSATPMFAQSGRDYLNNVLERRSQIQGWSIRCGVSASKDDCEVGDAVLFNGLLCLAGDELSCEAVRRSQGSDGRMWRAEFRLARDAVNSFSRDMAVGVLAYLVATRDTDLAKRWMVWIEQNDYRLCRESTDNRCDFTPGFWTLFRDVWEFLGLPLNEKMQSVVLDD
ncbi:hypothetical protein EBU99_10035, partial [bacterium]|nr:hypothetical protein [bacterium]